MNYSTRIDLLKFVVDMLDEHPRYDVITTKSDGFFVPFQIADCLNNVNSNRRRRGPDIEIAALETVLEIKSLGYLDKDKIDRMLEREMIRESCESASQTTKKRRGL